jgi:hypothetical protein
MQILRRLLAPQNDIVAALFRNLFNPVSAALEGGTTNE